MVSELQVYLSLPYSQEPTWCKERNDPTSYPLNTPLYTRNNNKETLQVGGRTLALQSVTANVDGDWGQFFLIALGLHNSHHN